MDILATTDFPDIRYKSLIQSADEGIVLLIPREGGYMVRMYVELDNLNPDERVANRDLSSDDLIAAAGRILKPYFLDVKDVVWWSVYEIGQRLTAKGTDPDAVIDLRCVLQSHHHGVSVSDLPEAFRPTKGRFGLVDDEKAFCVDHLSGKDIYAMRGINRAQGCIVIVRPDQYIADVMPLTDTARLSIAFLYLNNAVSAFVKLRNGIGVIRPHGALIQRPFFGDLAAVKAGHFL